MFIRKKSLIPAFSMLALGITLISCGGSGGSTPTVTLNGIVIDANNYESVFRSGVALSADIIEDLINLGDEVDPSTLDVLQTNGNVTSYRCSNQDGTLQITQVNTSTIELVFTNCDLPKNSPTTRYNNKVVVKILSSSGDVDQIPNVNFNWNLTQKATFTDLTLSNTGSGPVHGGRSASRQANQTIIFNGDAVVLQSNNIASSLVHNKLTSSNLVVDNTDISGNQLTYQYSQILYDTLSNYSNDDTNIDYDFTANITDIGDIQLTTNPVLRFVTNVVVLDSGSAVLTTGNSTVKFEGTGNNAVDVSLDPENDGTFEAPISTDWNQLSSPTLPPGGII